MHSQIDTIIFDVGGVLLPNYNKYIKEDISKTLGISMDDVNNAWNILIPEYLGRGKITEDEFWVKFKEITKHKKDIDTSGLLVRGYENHYAPFTLVKDIVKSLKISGYKLGIVSDTIKSHTEMHTKHGLFNNFSVKIFSHEVALRKPDPKIFQIALQQLNSLPENTVFIDDRPDIIEVVNKLGMQGIVFINDRQLKDDLENLGIKINIIKEKKYNKQGAFVLLLTKDNNILLQQRDVNSNIENSGKVGMFGGALDDDEDLLIGLKRELLEELELNISGYKIEKLNIYKKTKELDGVEHIVNVWVVFDVDLDTLKLHEGRSIICDKAEKLVKNENLTRITKLALQDFIKNN